MLYWYKYLPEDSVVVECGGGWSVHFAPSTWRIYIMPSERQPVPLSLEAGDLLRWGQMMAEWSDEMKERILTALEEGPPDMIRQMEIFHSRRPEYRGKEPLSVRVIMPGEPGYEEARKRMEEGRGRKGE